MTTSARARGGPSAPLGAGEATGREALLHRLDAVLADEGWVNLTGAEGVGKSTLSAELVRRTRARGERALVTALSPADRQLPCAAASLLLNEVPEDRLAALPEPRRRALAMARREVPVPDAGWDCVALRLAVQTLAAEETRHGPLLIVVDNAHWLDDESAALLRHVHLSQQASRALPDRAVRVLLVRRSPGADPLGRPEPAGAGPLDPPGPARSEPLGPPEPAGGNRAPDHCDLVTPAGPCGPEAVEVPPLGVDELAGLLEAEGLPARLLGRVYRASGGNPRLALAAAHAYAYCPTTHDGDEPPHLAAEACRPAWRMLRRLPAAVRATLLRAALAHGSTLGTLRRAGRPDADAEVSLARTAGLVEVRKNGAVVFRAGLFARALVDHADRRELTDAHRKLAAAVDDPLESLRHRALVTDERCESFAGELVRAVSAARSRGDGALAAELGLLAADLTPATLPGRRVARLAEAAVDASEAGHADLARRAARAVLALDATPTDRVRARLALLDTAEEERADPTEAYAHAVADAEGVPRLEALVALRRARRHLLCDGEPRRSATAALAACRAAQASGDTTLLAVARAARASAGRVLGNRYEQSQLLAALAATRAGTPARVANWPQLVAAWHDLRDDRIQHAREGLLALLPVLRRFGSAAATCETLRALAELEARAGRCSVALAHADAAAALVLRTDLTPGPTWYAAALAQSAGGSFARAARYAGHGARLCEQQGDKVFLSRNLCALGRTELFTGQVTAAVHTLGRVRLLEEAQGVADPSRLLWHADLAEALTANDAPAKARQVLAELRALTPPGPNSVRAGHDRSLALCLTAEGEPAAAAEQLRQVAGDFEALGLPLEQGRTLLALTRVERRRRRRSAAEETLRQAAELFRRNGARPWLDLCHALSQTPRPADAATTERGGPIGLTPAELRLARLVSEGASNQEAATRLFISVKTVESRLTRIYQKLDLRSRAQLAKALHEQAVTRSGR
ncbi:helix-turn-helix domain-containing protein [Streptomyces sp. NA04227]|uniref:helix-turn-helix transcriptional regulator n=1 Tax=Streptomyces sp. NA04227 TaxID=2742136 RepID=UPI00159219A7|nr:LuxR family transcriptional regulator [Streptomyces sp. NA04227]QKW10419.1 helix-turn-helix domain-containing protein [Streptomyces sp. NA04227]